MACFNEQNNQGPKVQGIYGREYFKLSYPSSELKSSGQLLTGSVGSICDSDYSNVLGNISGKVKNNLKTIGLRCKDPLHLDIFHTNSPSRKIPFTIVGGNMVLDNELDPGVAVTVEMECPNIH